METKNAVDSFWEWPTYIWCAEHMMWIVCLFLLYGIATVFQLYHGSNMSYEMRRRKPEPTLLTTQGIFNLPHHIGVVWEELAFDDAVSYTHGICTPVSRVTNWAISAAPESELSACFLCDRSLDKNCEFDHCTGQSTDSKKCILVITEPDAPN